MENLFKTASKEMTAAIVTISLLAVGSFARVEEPRPFGLIIGKTTIQDAQVAIAKEGGKILLPNLIKHGGFTL